jgi:quercetin dioxygenase-like cupin family protein
MRRNAPICGGPDGRPAAEFIKSLDERFTILYRQTPLPTLKEEELAMATSAREEIKVGEMAIRFLVEGERSAGSVALFEFDVPVGAKVAAGHSHDGYEETIYGLKGILTWTIEGTPTEVGPGEALCIPRGAVHRFDNTSDVDAKALAIVTPGILGPDYFLEVAAILDAAASGPPDLAAIAAVMRRHGLTPAP